MGRVITNVPGQLTQISYSMESSLGGFTADAEPQRNSETDVRFTMRYRDGITPASHQIIWDNAVWNIRNVLHDRRRVMLFLDCEATKVDVTHLQSTEREFIDDNLPLTNPRSG